MSDPSYEILPKRGGCLPSSSDESSLMTKTKRIKDSTFFSKSREFKDTDREISKTKAKTKCTEDPTFAIFSKNKDIQYDQTRPGQKRLQYHRPNSRTA